MKRFKLVAGGVALAACLSIAACGDDGDKGSSDAPTTASSTTPPEASSGSASGSVSDPSKPPTAKALDAMLQKALNSAVPNSQKTNLVEGSEADPQLFDKLVKAKKDNPGVTYQIIPPVVADGPNKAKATVKIQLPDNPPSNVNAAIVYQNGSWRLAKSTVCPLLQANNIASAMCPKTS